MMRLSSRSLLHLIARSLTAVGLLAGLFTPLRAQPAAINEACAQISAACERAGFVYGRFKSGRGLELDCIRPIMGGILQPAKARLPLPSIDPPIVAACRASNPTFGYERRAPRLPSAGLLTEPGFAAAMQPPGSSASPFAEPGPSVPTEQSAQLQPVQSGPPLAPGSRPNIVFVLTDDLSMNLVQYMPHVLQMQKDGVSFANYFVTDSLCCPSRTSIFTGRYPHDTGVFTNTGNDGGYLQFRNRRLAQQTFATALAAAGYRTAMLGKYLNGYHPKDPPELGWSSWSVAGNGYPEFHYRLNEDGSIKYYGNNPTDYLTDVLSGMGSSLHSTIHRRPVLDRNCDIRATPAVRARAARC